MLSDIWLCLLLEVSWILLVDFSTIKFCVFRCTTSSISDSTDQLQLNTQNIKSSSTQLSVCRSDWTYKENISKLHNYVMSFQEYMGHIKYMLVCNLVTSHTPNQKCIPHTYPHTDPIALCTIFICVMNITVSLFAFGRCKFHSMWLWTANVGSTFRTVVWHAVLCVENRT